MEIVTRYQFVKINIYVYTVFENSLIRFEFSLLNFQ